MLAALSTEIKSKNSVLMIEVLKSFISVGFQTRFQTAGNLIFDAPQNSTLSVTGNLLFNFRKVALQ
jgi:hypothetical protein